jgi:hypothetical protein
MMDEAIERMSATADMHHQLHDPILFEKGLELMLREVVATVIDQSSVSLNLNVEEPTYHWIRRALSRCSL